MVAFMLAHPLTPAPVGAPARGLCLALVVSLCAFVGALAVAASPALAAQAPVVEEQWVTHVSATAATLEAKVNPGEAATTYKFEYATSEAALLAGEGEVVPAPPASEGEAGAGSEGVVVEEHPQDLQPHTIYWYRLEATNGEGKASGCEAAGTCQSFTTRGAGGELVLPDGRAWELVSPAVKDGARILPIEVGGLVQAAEDGGAITYLSVGPLGIEEGAPAGNANETQVLSVRHAGGGWTSRDLASSHEVTTGVSVGHGQEYRYFSPNLSVGIVEPFGSGFTGSEAPGAAPLSQGASEKTIYLSADKPLTSESASQAVVYGEAEAEGVYKPLVTSKVGYANVPESTKFGAQLTFVGSTADSSHVVLYSGVSLNAPERGLYEWSAGMPVDKQLQLVSVLPDGSPASEGNLGNANGDDVRGAISSDGSRIVWSYNEHLYMRDVPRERTVDLDAIQGGTGGIHISGAHFQFANNDGSKIFFTDEEQLTENSTAFYGEPDLYECEIVEQAGEISCKLADLTVDPGEPATVQGVVGVGSKEDTSLYFVATGELTKSTNGHGETAKMDADNLYLLHYDEQEGKWEAPVFIAVLSKEDAPDWAGNNVEGDLEAVTSRVSPDGSYFVFMSNRSLTGYDNHDAKSGELDEEIYEYHRGSGEPGKLVCVSCDPTNERPSGVLDSNAANEGEGLLADGQAVWRGWVAGNLPGWTAMRLNTALYQSRYLSDSGTVFFNSSDRLVAQATNGLTNVYEYHPVGVSGCENAGSTFSPRSNGCIGLISSGSSGEESVFLDASKSGEDVFFLTSAPLVAADQDTAFDVYDAHVCSVLAPCVASAVSPPPCSTEASCKSAPAPQPAIFGSGSSETFSGVGNVAPLATSVVKPRANRLSLAQKLSKALNACRTEAVKLKRVRCDKRARKRYGAVKAVRSIKTGRRAK